VTPLLADRRGATGQIGVPVEAVGVAGWPSWLDGWRDLAEIATSRRCARAATRLSPDLIWERHSLFSDAGWKVARSTGARWILEVNAPLVQERSRYERLRRPALAASWERDVLLAADEIVAVSAWLVDWLGSLGCKRVRDLPNGVSAEVGDRAAARARLGLDGRFVLGFLGSMKPWHGVARLPAIFDAVRRQIPEAVLLVVGDGPETLSHPGILRTGTLSEAGVADCVAAMDVALAPYAADAPPWFSPLKIPAYRAQGTPVVATDVGDCAAMVGGAGTVLPASASDADIAEAALAWRTRERPPAVLRSWANVVSEALGSA
jgi:glycosyltransferase involved in cell wall biosynthesis